MKTTDILNLTSDHGRDSVQTVRYGSLPRQNMDIYHPNDAEPIKTPVIFVYGGAWIAGERGDYGFVAHALTRSGHPVIIPDYRLSPEVSFPDFINDVADAIAYLDQHAPELLHSPLNNYVLMGHSAGAHTVALLGTDQTYLSKRKIHAKLSGIIALAGPYDLDLSHADVMPVFGDASAQASKPLLNVQPSMPPVLLLHGGADQRVGVHHTERFAKALREAGVPVIEKIYAGVNHTKIIGSLARPLRWLNASDQDIQAFLTEIDSGKL